MIDLHTHILPGMDDGPTHWKESLSMLAMLRDQGVTTVALTPHYYAPQESVESFVRRREASHQLIAGEGMELLLGSETYLSDTLFRNDTLYDLCIGDTNYLLLELPYASRWEPAVFERVEQLIHTFHVKPILAHPERFEATQNANREKIFAKLTDLGCLLQFNIDSVVSPYSQKTTLELIQAGWGDVIGSDCHNTRSRPPQHHKFREIITKHIGDYQIETFQQNARTMIK